MDPAVDHVCDSGPGESAELVGGDHSFVIGLVREPGTDTGQHLVEILLRPVTVQTDHEGMAEAALVRRVRGAQRGPGGGRRAVRRARGGLAGERFGEVRRGEVVTGLVGRREQGFEIGIGTVRDQPLGPALAAAAGE